MVSIHQAVNVLRHCHHVGIYFHTLNETSLHIVKLNMSVHRVYF